MIAQTDAASQGIEQMVIMIVCAAVFFYFILWRPEQKRRKAMEAQREGLKKGDHVIVAGGILAEIVTIRKETVVVSLVDGAKMEVLKGAILDVQLKQDHV